MATFKFNIFVQDVGRKVHNLNTDTLKIMLTNTAPVATNAVDGDITENQRREWLQRGRQCGRFEICSQSEPCDRCRCSRGLWAI